MNPRPPAPESEDFWTSRRFLLLLTVVILAAFPKVVLGLNTFFYHDSGALGYPGAFYFQQSLFSGELPLWNPYSHCGVPFLAQMGQWYPFNWLLVWLPLPWSANVSVLVHLLLGGWGMFVLTRRWGMNGFAAGFAGLAYAFNGVSLSCFQWGNYIASLGWLPWTVLAVMQAWRSGGRWILVAAVVSAIQVLTATPELTLMGWGLLGVLWLVEWLSGKIKLGSSAGRVGFVILLAAGITMVQMLPFFDLLAHSQRDSNYAQPQWSMPGWGWANLLVPLFHCYLSPQGNWYQPGQDFFVSYYPGLGVLVLAVVGLWQNRSSRVMGLVVLACWILALGEAGVLYPFAKTAFPWIGIARYPVKFTILTSFMVPVLAAWAVHKIQSETSAVTRKRLIWSTAIFLTLTAALVWFARKYPLPFDGTEAMTRNAIVRMVMLAALVAGLLCLTKTQNRPSRLAVQLSLFGILLGDLLTHSPGIVPTLPSSVLAPGLWQAQGKPVPALGTGRIMASPQAEEQMLFSRVADPQLDFLGKRLVEWYNLNLLDSLPKVNGAFTLRSAEFDLIERRIYYTHGTSFGAGLADFLSAAWISDPANSTKWIARTNHLPLLTAGQQPEFKSGPQTLEAIFAADFDPRRVVYLPEAARHLIMVTNQTSCLVSQIRYRQNQVEAETHAAAPSLIVLSQTYYHLWQAEVDGQNVPLFRANLAFQALQVPAGTHQIKLVYRDPYLVSGAAISVASLLICIILWRRQPQLEKLDPSAWDI